MNTENYQIRYSKKAKYLQLRISPHIGLELIIPAAKKFPPSTIEKFLTEKESWIKKNLLRLSQLNNQEQHSQLLPALISLKAINQEWKVAYIATKNKKLELIANAANEITLIGNTENKEKCLEKLRVWITMVAEYFLSVELAKISREVNLPFQNINIRNNNTRWGSCSRQKNISLCCKLLFLPHNLMRHVLIHELCHTKIMNHGHQFWKLMERLDNRARDHAKELREAVKTIPQWVNIPITP